MDDKKFDLEDIINETAESMLKKLEKLVINYLEDDFGEEVDTIHIYPLKAKVEVHFEDADIENNKVEKLAEKDGSLFNDYEDKGNGAFIIHFNEDHELLYKITEVVQKLLK